jgi:hypothetical protein
MVAFSEIDACTFWTRFLSSPHATPLPATDLMRWSSTSTLSFSTVPSDQLPFLASPHTHSLTLFAPPQQKVVEILGEGGRDACSDYWQDGGDLPSA